MIRYTTPSLVLRIPVEIRDAKIIISLKQGMEPPLEYTASDSDVTIEDGETVIKVRLSQSQTARLKANVTCKVQANWIYEDGSRNATEEKAIKIRENLLERVVKYG